MEMAATGFVTITAYAWLSFRVYLCICMHMSARVDRPSYIYIYIYNIYVCVYVR